MNNNISIIDDFKNQKLDEKVQLYIDIFGEQPWNEWYQCKNCETLYALSQVKREEISQCLCWWDLQAFYNPDELKKDWESWASKAWYILKLAQTLEGDLIWFIMWWENNLDTLNQEKLSLSQEDLELVKGNIQTLYPEFDSKKFFYAADIGVKANWRGAGVASQLYDAREQDIQQQWFNYVIVRTTKDSDVPYVWYKQKWFQEVYEYNDAQNRVIMVKPV